MTITSANPADLTTYVEAAYDGSERLTTAAADLGAALDAFRASEGRATFLADVPEVDLDLSFLAQRWLRLAGWVAGVARAFAAADGGGAGGTLTLDDDALHGRIDHYVAPEVELIRREGRLILDAGVGDDTVVVGDEGGLLRVLVNGTFLTLEVGRGDTVDVRGGVGDDRIAVTPATRTPPRDGLVLDGGSGSDVLAVPSGGALLRGGSGDDDLKGGDGADRLLGGAGDDDIAGRGGDDRIIAGDGDDVVDGGAGDDWVSAGGGEDLVYGEAGDDLLDGGADRDHVDGGTGADRLAGGDGADILSGGDGNDQLHGGAGADVAYAGLGVDLVKGGRGADVLHVEPGDVVGGATRGDTVGRRAVDPSRLDAITVVVDPVLDPDGFLADRIRSDLATLAATEAGALLLEGLEGQEVTVVAYDHGDSQVNGQVRYDPEDDEAGFGPAGADRPAFSLSVSPLVTIHHELVHAYDALVGGAVQGVYLGPDAHQSGRVRIDQDGDGLVEADGTADRDDLWEVVDEDGDGVVTRIEIERAGDDNLRRPPEVAGDLDGDGQLTRADGWAPNAERDAVGLPVDHDQDPSTPAVPGSEARGHPDGLSENALREELGVEIRGRY
ncbi:MAG TPA: M91 family zinc metallopeptidase [Iamia sp.]|jgi:hypothetical protein|nr:M91 family zinc metallopeptidase [Iamia sp.]